MKKTKLLFRTFMFTALLGGIVASATSCKDSGSDAELKYGTVSGKIVDETGTAVSGATVTVSGMSETATSASDGSYSIANVSNARHSVTASMTGYQTASKTVRASSFVDGKADGFDIELLRTNSRIVGIVMDESKDSAPITGVKVRAGKQETETGADGKFEITGLAAGDYTVSFTYSNYSVVNLNVAKNSFSNELYDMGNVYLGGGDVLKTYDRYELANATKLLYDDYRAGSAGGGTAAGGAFWDWSTGFLPAMVDRYGNIEIQREGFALRPSEGGGNFTGEWDGIDERRTLTLPQDLDHFHAFLFGMKKITATNSKLTVRVRCHQAPSTFGVQVVDLSAPSPRAIKIATFTQPNDQYLNYNADLSAYEGKEVIVVVGQYRDLANGVTATDYWHQLPVARLTFSSAFIPNADTWWPGDEVVPGWKLTRQMVANTGVQSRLSFSGMPIGDQTDHRAIGAWYGSNHIGANWHLIAVSKDVEVANAAGFIIKTSNPGTVNTNVPESFLYAKFAIADGSNKVVLRARTMSNANTYFKLAAFDENGVLLDYITPTGDGIMGSAGTDDTWKFSANTGSYGQFEFDLSAYNGQNVTVALGVFKGEVSAEENKLAIQSIAIQ